MQQITFESHPLSFINNLEEELKQLKLDLNNAPRVKSQLLIADDDAYQDNLELSWWIEEQLESIRTAESELTHYFSRLSETQRAQYKLLKDSL